MALDPLFIDTGGVDLFVDPPDSQVVSFWGRFAPEAAHYICEIVYWEYLRQFDPRRRSIGWQRFRTALKKGRLSFLPFRQREADIAIQIYQGVKRRLSDDQGGKLRLKDMQCDIMIASVGVAHQKTVLTMDVKDWALIRECVQYDGLGTLALADRKDIARMQ